MNPVAVPVGTETSTVLMPLIEKKAGIARAPLHFIADGVSKDKARPPAYQDRTDCKYPIQAFGALIASARGIV